MAVIRKVAITGPSMEPALREGDWLLFRTWDQGLKAAIIGASGLAYEASHGNIEKKHRADIASRAEKLVGKIILFERVAQPALLQVKRVKRILQSTSGEYVFWVEGDNSGASTDSRTWGGVALAEVKGVALVRYKRAR